MKKFLFSLFLSVCAIALFSDSGNAQTRLMYYWNFNSTSGTFHLPTLPPVNSDFSITGTPAQMFDIPAYTVSGSYASYYDISAAATADFDTVNLQMGATTGNYFRARNPNDSMQLLFYIPTTHYQNITINYGTETSSLTSGDSAQIYSYSLDSGITWLTTGLSTPSTILNTLTWDTFRRASVTITDPGAYNNPKFVFKIQLVGRNHGTSGNNRFDNITVSGDTILPSGTLIYFWDFNTFTGSYANPNFPYIAPDYFIHDSSKAKVHMGLYPGTSLSNPTYFDNVAFAGSDYDTVNQNWSSVPALGIVPGGNGIRHVTPWTAPICIFTCQLSTIKTLY